MTDLDADYRSGSTEPWTVELLAALVRAKRPHVLIETGTFEARTTVKLVEAMETYGLEHGSMLYTLECDPERFQAAQCRLGQLQFEMLSKPHSGMVGVTLLDGDALTFLRERPAGFADFIFVDDDHTQAHVEAELTECLRILRPGGIVCGHDVIGPFCLGELFTARGGIVLDLPRLHAAGGLGIISR